MSAKAEKKHGLAWELVTASIVAVLFSLVLILLCALLIKWLNLSDKWLMPINEVIKAVSIFAGAMIAFKEKHNGWLKGLIFGVIYIILAFFIFSLIALSFKIDISLLWDLLFGAAAGLICGVVAVNIKGRKG